MDTKQITEALTTVANFIGEDTETFANEMLARKVEADKAKKRNRLNLRTKEAREAFDRQVHTCLYLCVKEHEEMVPAVYVLNELSDRYGIDATKAQVRDSLNRLIEAGNVTYEGIRRGTRARPRPVPSGVGRTYCRYGIA